MYPIDGFCASSPDKTEAVRYYVDLNKTFLKETSIEEYEEFSEFMKGAGKDILINISSAKDDKTLLGLLLKIESQLSYAANLKGKTFEQKLNIIYRELAKAFVDSATPDRKATLKKQRELDSMYDEVVKVCDKYRDAVNNQQFLRSTLENGDELNKLYAGQNCDKAAFKQKLITLAEETKVSTKLARTAAFAKIREYGIKDMALQMEQEQLGIEK